MDIILEEKTSPMDPKEKLRMTVNQVTYGILISALVVANILLVWAFGYIINFFERRGELLINRYGKFPLVEYKCTVAQKTNSMDRLR